MSAISQLDDSREPSGLPMLIFDHTHSTIRLMRTFVFKLTISPASLPISVGSAKAALHLKWAYYQFLSHLLEGPLLSALEFHTKTVLHFPCVAGVGSVVEVGPASRHGYTVYTVGRT